jgi:hypothetical protein
MFSTLLSGYSEIKSLKLGHPMGSSGKATRQRIIPRLMKLIYIKGFDTLVRIVVVGVTPSFKTKLLVHLIHLDRSISEKW